MAIGTEDSCVHDVVEGNDTGLVADGATFSDDELPAFDDDEVPKLEDGEVPELDDGAGDELDENVIGLDADDAVLSDDVADELPIEVESDGVVVDEPTVEVALAVDLVDGFQVEVPLPVELEEALHIDVDLDVGVADELNIVELDMEVTEAHREDELPVAEAIVLPVVVELDPNQGFGNVVDSGVDIDSERGVDGDPIVVFDANVGVESQSGGSLGPSSSSSESGARVQAGASLVELSVLLNVIVVEIVVTWSLGISQPVSVKSSAVKHEVDVDVAVVAEVVAKDKDPFVTVLIDRLDDNHLNSPQYKTRSVYVLYASGPHFVGFSGGGGAVGLGGGPVGLGAGGGVGSPGGFGMSPGFGFLPGQIQSGQGSHPSGPKQNPSQPRIPHPPSQPNQWQKSTSGNRAFTCKRSSSGVPLFPGHLGNGNPKKPQPFKQLAEIGEIRNK